jgi:hypothetical protein
MQAQLNPFLQAQLKNPSCKHSCSFNHLNVFPVVRSLQELLGSMVCSASVPSSKDAIPLMSVVVKLSSQMSRSTRYTCSEHASTNQHKSNTQHVLCCKLCQ